MIYECLKSYLARILKIDNVHDTDTFAEYCIAFLIKYSPSLLVQDNHKFDL